MPDSIIDPMTGPRYVLEGKLVTMGPQGVVNRGAIYIDAGEIIAVQGSRKTPPPGFEDAPRIRTGDTIYPGLIELHNHLCYNAMPLWDVPRRYTNNGQWKTHPDYRRQITKPSQVLGRTPGVVEALVRFVECKCLLGATTTSQGITLSSAPGIQVYYEGLIRNVERTQDDLLPEAGTKIANPSTGKAQGYLAKLQKHSCYLQHLSEGTDQTARGWFLRLQLEDGSWAVNPAFCGIHSTALNQDDFNVIQSRGGSMVWSPLSNYLLYGGTVDIRAAKASGILMGLGSDWAPSGSKNMLGELKVAWLASQEMAAQEGAPVFSPRELVEMATINAARILRWEGVLGSIEPGKRADLIAVNGMKGDDYLRMIEARETSLTLVVINGIPRMGQPRLMAAFGPGTEQIRVGRSTRVLNLAQETAHPLVRDLPLSAATQRLEEALANLPTLAEDLDNAALGGFLGGSADAQGTTWRMVMDIEEEGVDDAYLAAQPLASYVQPMDLEGITVADDKAFLRNLVAARNLPEFVKKGLPPLYGQSIPIPESAGFLLETPESLPEEVLSTTVELKTFLRTWGELTRSQRLTIVEQALLIIEENYVHLPLKRAMHAVEPVQRLKLLRHRLEETRDDEMPPEIDFHNTVTLIFNSLRDLHTAYRLPEPFKNKTAWLPFMIEEFWEHGHRKYLVSRTVGNPGPATFGQGVEIVYWNGMPMHQAVTRNANRLAGSNPAARHARGLEAMTIRPLAYGLPPEEEWVTLHYQDAQGIDREWTQPWLVFEAGQRGGGLDPADLKAETTAMGLDAQSDAVREVKKVLYAADVWEQEKRTDQGVAAQAYLQTSSLIGTYMPAVFRAGPVTTQIGTFGYIRIFTFNVVSPDAFVSEFTRLVQNLPTRGLIIDVRGNPGGHIHAAERLLRILTPRTVEPQKAQFINTPLNRDICRRHAPSKVFRGLDLSPWVASIEQSVETGAVYSLGFAITPPEAFDGISQVYYGPKVLIVDALCYSATDIMAAGFKDHNIGPILGTSENTGAGGANVWSHRLLHALTRTSGATGAPVSSPYTPLPKGGDLRVAVRRTLRVGSNAGTPVEDLGIQPDRIHRMSRRDLLDGNADLLESAANLIAEQKRYDLTASVEPQAVGLPHVVATTRNITRLDVLLNDRPQRSLDVDPDAVTRIDLNAMASDRTSAAPMQLTLYGYAEDELVVEYQASLPRL